MDDHTNSDVEASYRLYAAERETSLMRADYTHLRQKMERINEAIKPFLVEYELEPHNDAPIILPNKKVTQRVPTMRDLRELIAAINEP